MATDKNTHTQIVIPNKRANFEYQFILVLTAGIVLTGTEIKSIRSGKANLTDAYCVFVNDELFAKNITIAEYEKGNYNNHAPKRDRKLLLNKAELRKLHAKVKEKGLTIVPTKLFINEKGLAKLEIALAKGKKLYDKRESIKQRDIDRQMKRKEY